MKRILLLILAGCFVALLSVTCNKQDNVSNGTDDNSYDTIKSIIYTIDEISVDDDNQPQTKTTVNSTYEIFWADGDTVGIYPNQGSQVYFTVESGGTPSAMFDGGGWAFKAGSTYSSYYPFIGNIYLDKTRIPVSFTGQKQTGTSGMGHLGEHMYMYTDPSSVESGVLTFNYKHLWCILRVTATLPAGTYTKLAITAPSNVFVKKGHYNLSAGNCSIVGDEYSNQIQIDLENITLTSQTEFKIHIASAPVDLANTEITVSVLDSQKKELQCKKIPTKTYVAGKVYGHSCSSWTEVPQSMGMIIADWGNSGTVSGDAD